MNDDEDDEDDLSLQYKSVKHIFDIWLIIVVINQAKKKKTFMCSCM